MITYITPKTGSKNIIIKEDGICNVKNSDFILIFDVDFNNLKVSKASLILKENFKNNFTFSVYKDYENKIITLKLEGTKDNNFYITGLEINTN